MEKKYNKITYLEGMELCLKGIVKIQTISKNEKYFIKEYYLSEEMLKPVFDFDYYKDQKVVVHCDTEEKANIFCRLMHQNGMRWGSGSSYLEKNGLACRQ